MEKKLVVPSGMVDAAYGKAIEDADGKVRYSPVDAVKSHERLGVERILEAALRWLSEKPIVPTPEQANDLWKATNGALKDVWPILIVTEWQRIMFRAPEPEVPEEIKDLLHISLPETPEIVQESVRSYIIEAYRRGKAAK